MFSWRRETIRDLVLTDRPQIDIKRFKDLGGFNTEKTASNTWGKIKNKLLSGGDGASPAMATGRRMVHTITNKIVG